jgi:predicted dehydrogenase
MPASPKKTDRPYGFGIIGLGMIADFHAKAVKDIPGARLVAVASRSADKAAAFAAKHGCEAVADFRALLDRPDVDVVTICTPSGAHREPALAAAAAGKHCIVEKPIEIDLARIDEMVTAHERAGTRLAGVFPYRFGRTVRLLKDTVEKGRFGRITFGGAFVPWWRSQEYYDKGGWKGTAALDGGGALMNQSIHAIDTLQWLLGPVDSVTAQTAVLAHKNIEVEDTAVATVSFRSGALAVIVGTTSIYPGFLRRIEVCGDRGSAIVEEEALRYWKFAEETADDDRIRSEFSAQGNAGGGVADPAAISYAGHRKQFEQFLAALSSDGPLEVDGRESRKAVEIILAIYESAKTGRAVKVGA